jgi:hypothetical protein
VSAFDWLFGDFWACRQVPWPYASGGAAISLSTALGLAVLRSLRSDGPNGEGASLVSRAVGAGLAAVRDVIEGGLARITAVVDPRRDLRDKLAAALDGVVRRATTGQVRDAESHVAALAAAWRSAEVARLAEVLGDAVRILGPRTDLTILSLLEHDAALRAGFGAGTEILPFLAAAVAHEQGQVDVIVTGHSKGGVLAPTLALWLAETQGPGTPANERWDPDGRATVQCYAYAGPTAGNSEFSARSKTKLPDRCHRFANPYDVVPHAWMGTELEQIPSLYDDVVPHSAAIADLIQIVVTLTKPLGYTQIETRTDVPTGLPDYPKLAQKPLFFDQFVYQHMEAYLRAFGLTDHGIDTATFFDPMASLPG